MRSLLFITAFFFASLALGNSDSKIPTTRDLLKILIHSQAVKLDTSDETKGCKGVESQVGGAYDLGDYLSFLISSLDPQNGKSGVSSSCKKSKERYDCEIKFSTGLGTESPWTYGIHFTLDDNKKLLPNSLRCPGSS